MAKEKIRIVPLGGLGEIGKNMTVFEMGNDAFILDTGIMFPANDMHGVDYIIPDFSYLKNRTDLKIHGIVYTHGHEDHTGAVSHVIDAFKGVPIYATPLTAGLLEVKLRDAKLIDKTQIKVFKAGDKINVGPFKLESFHVCHSIPDCVGFGINTPHGYIVHTGDYKFDNSPVDGKKPDYGRLAAFGQRGVLLLMADSTNADKPGWTPSESVIDSAFDRVFAKAKGRIMVATFASLISRIQQVVWAAKKHDRKIAIAGYSMTENIKMARKLGYLDIPDKMLVDIKDIASIQPHKLVLMVTGTQGEPSAVLGRLAMRQHRFLDIMEDDTIVLSSHPIPGNEEMVYRTINQLIQRGANVIYDPVESVHVSGHAYQEEMKLTMSLTKPRFFMPVHGELRHLVEHKKLGVASGIPENNIVAVENGTIIELDRHSIRAKDRVPGDYVFVDGSTVGDVGRVVIRDREILARDGFMVISVNVKSKSGEIIGEPDIISRGFVYLKDADDLFSLIKKEVNDTIWQTRNQNGRRRDMLEQKIGRLLYDETQRRPMVFTIINEV